MYWCHWTYRSYVIANSRLLSATPPDELFDMKSNSFTIAGGVQEVRGTPGPRLQRRTQADRQAVLHQQRIPLIQEIGVKRVSRK